MKENKESAVTCEINNHIADVRINRPKKYNAINADVITEMNLILDELESIDDLRVVVLSGNNGNFCAGIDIEMLAGVSGASKKPDSSSKKSSSKREPKELYPRSDTFPNKGQRLSTGWHDLSVPVIAALDGCVFGAGMQVALGADIRVARADAKLSIMETKWGLIPDMGITRTIRHLLPRDVAMKLTLTSQVLSGSDAKELGLVTDIVEDPLTEAFKLAESIASKSPDATSLTKALFNYAWDHEPEQGLQMEEELVLALSKHPNQLEAVKANLQNREPDFVPRVIKDISKIKLVDGVLEY